MLPEVEVMLDPTISIESCHSWVKRKPSTCAPGWQNLAAFRRGKNGHENFRQARIYNFRDKCVVFVRNRKFANLSQ